MGGLDHVQCILKSGKFDSTKIPFRLSTHKIKAFLSNNCQIFVALSFEKNAWKLIYAA